MQRINLINYVIYGIYITNLLPKMSNKTVAVLSSSLQSKSVIAKSQSLKKRNAASVKSALQSPFSLEWPNISQKKKADVMQAFHSVFSNTSVPSFKAPWHSIKHLKGKMRKEFIREYNEKRLKNALEADPALCERVLKGTELRKQLLFGFNAVTRAISKGEVCAVIAKRNTEPEFIVQTLLPGCATYGVPIFPLDDLDKLIAHDDLLGFKHQCIALGLRRSVSSKDSPLYELYVKLCHAVEMEPLCDQQVSPVDEEVSEDEVNGDKGSQKKEEEKGGGLVSEDVIQSLYLKKSGQKRAFLPPSNATSEDGSFIGIGSLPVSQPSKMVKYKRNRGMVKLTVSRGRAIDLRTLSSGDMFFLDTKSDDVPTQDEKELLDDVSEPASNKRKIKQVPGFHIEYVPAVTKKIKANPDRRGGRYFT